MLWLEAAIELRDDSPTEIVRHLKENGISLARQNFYEWKQNPEFAQWWEEQWVHILRGIQKETVKQAVKIGMDQAKAGRIDFLDRILELVHLKTPEPVPGSVPAAMTQVNIMADAFFKSAKERGVDVEQQST